MRAERGVRARWIGAALWLSLLARLVLAGVFAWAGLAKVGDLPLSRLSVRSYQLLPNGLADLIGNALPFVELALAALLLIGLGTRLVAAVSGLLLAGFVVGIASLWIRGIEAACGCFGTSLLSDGTVTSYPLLLTRDVGLLVLAALVVLTPISRWSVDAALSPETVRNPTSDPPVEES